CPPRFGPPFRRPPLGVGGLLAAPALLQAALLALAPLLLRLPGLVGFRLRLGFLFGLLGGFGAFDPELPVVGLDRLLELLGQVVVEGLLALDRAQQVLVLGAQE